MNIHTQVLGDSKYSTIDHLLRFITVAVTVARR